MEKSSLNIKSFRNLLSNQSKNYKIAPNSYHPTEVKLTGLNDDSSPSCHNLDDIYSIKLNKVDSSNASECDRSTLSDAICGGLVKLVGNYNSSFCLTVLTPVACSVSVIIIVAAIAGPLWIQTEERIPWLAVNSSHYRSNYTVSYIIKSSNASLWILCTRQGLGISWKENKIHNFIVRVSFRPTRVIDVKLHLVSGVLSLDDNRTKLDFNYKNCSQIDYFAVDYYQPDPRDSVEPHNVIPYTITLSAPLLIISFIILLISYLLFLLAICSQKYKIFYFVAGIGFIISGLLSLSGLIMFISIFKSEVYHKLRPVVTNKDPSFTFNYGQSFILYVIGFVVVELSGILNVCLFNKLQKIEQFNQLNNHKIGLADSEASSAHNMCQHRVPFPSIVENGYLPQKRRCSLHVIPNNRVSNLPSPQVTHFDEFNHHTLPTPFRRNASTSTLDLVGENDDAMSVKSNHRTINSCKDKSAVSNKLDFNNICGMMRSNAGKSKETNARCGRLKAKNIYYIEERKDEEPNIFIIDPNTINKHNKKFHQLQKSLEDVRIHKMSNQQATPACNNDCDATIGWNFMDRNYYGSRTLPRDFARRNIRPGLDNLLNSIPPNTNEVDRSDTLGYQFSNQNPNNLYPPPFGYAHHHSSFDELSSGKSSRQQNRVNFADMPKPQEYQWPKVIPKSPSSFSMNSFRLQRQPPAGKCPNYNWLDEIEYERRKSLSMFKENVKNTDFGTAV